VVMITGDHRVTAESIARQLALLRRLYEYLVPGGYLFVGHSETLTGTNLPLFTVAPTVYRKPG